MPYIQYALSYILDVPSHVAQLNLESTALVGVTDIVWVNERFIGDDNLSTNSHFHSNVWAH